MKQIKKLYLDLYPAIAVRFQERFLWLPKKINKKWHWLDTIKCAQRLLNKEGRIKWTDITVVTYDKYIKNRYAYEYYNVSLKRFYNDL